MMILNNKTPAERTTTTTATADVTAPQVDSPSLKTSPRATRSHAPRKRSLIRDLTGCPTQFSSSLGTIDRVYFWQKFLCDRVYFWGIFHATGYREWRSFPLTPPSLLWSSALPPCYQAWSLFRNLRTST